MEKPGIFFHQTLNYSKMSSSKAFTISYKNDDSWFAQVGPQLKATFDNDKLSFDNEIGKGDFYRVDIDLGLRCFRQSRYGDASFLLDVF